MDVAPHADLSGPRHAGRMSEPRWLTLADLGVIVAGVALALILPSRLGVGSIPPGAAPALHRGGLRSQADEEFRPGARPRRALPARTVRGPVRPAEWLALGLASLHLLDLAPNLDEAVNAWYAFFGPDSLDFGVARWLLSAPAAAGVVSIAAGSALLRRRARDGSRAASALTVVAIVGGSSLWFWGPCEVARLQLPSLLVPAPRGAPSSWGWRGTVALALREMVAHGPAALAWGVPAAVAARAWRADRLGSPRAWVWTEPAASADALAAALLLFPSVGIHEAVDFARQASWVACVGLASWWISGRLGVGPRDIPAL